MNLTRTKTQSKKHYKRTFKDISATAGLDDDNF